MKKSLSCLLALIMIVCVAVPFFAYADVGYACDKASLLQEDDYDIYESGYSSERAINVPDGLEQLITNSLRNLDTTFNVQSYKIKINDFRVIYTNIINNNPDLFYVSSSYEYRYLPSTGCVAIITPEYVMSASEIAVARDIFNAGVNKSLSVLDDSMTDLQKVLVMHDYFCDIAYYPNDDQPIYHSAYGIFYNGSTVCAGYALAFSYIMQQIGIDSAYVVSADMGHAWNAVCVDDNWYYIDLTYDDLSVYGDCNNLNAMQHLCFLKSSEAFESEPCFYHYGYSQPDYVSCDDTSYDSYFWDEVDTNIEVINGDYYYLKPDYSTLFANLVRRDVDGNEQNVINKPFRFTYTSLSSVTPDADGVVHTVSFKDPLLRMKYYDNRFYVTAYNLLFSVMSDGSTCIIEQVPVDNTSIYVSMGIVDGNLATLQMSNNNQYNIYNRMDYFNSYFSDGGVYNNYADKDNNGYINAIDYLLIR